ncbi:MAG: DsbA family oxidoreductase [Nitrospiraceae bacterium]
MNDALLQIDVFSDIVCPWCYIGKRRLEQSLDAAGLRACATVTWRPFQLNPTMPEQGMDRRVYMESKFGSPREVAAIHERVAAAGTAVGIDFAFDRIRRSPNTFAAHRVMHAAALRGPDVQDRLAERLFRVYFLEGGNIGDPETLVAAAADAGLDAHTIRDLLVGHDHSDAVRDEEARGRTMGIRGVPLFVIQGPVAADGERPVDILSGAQPVEAFLAAFATVGAVAAGTRGPSRTTS